MIGYELKPSITSRDIIFHLPSSKIFKGEATGGAGGGAADET